MTISVHCEECDYRFRVENKYSGKVIRCPGCRGAVTVPVITVVPKALPSPSAADPSVRQAAADRDLLPDPERRSSPAMESAVARRIASVATTARRRQLPDSRRYTHQSPLRIVGAVAGGILAVGLLALFAFRMGQSGNGDPRAVADADAGPVSSIRGDTLTGSAATPPLSEKQGIGEVNPVPPASDAAPKPAQGQDGSLSNRDAGKSGSNTGQAESAAPAPDEALGNRPAGADIAATVPTLGAVPPSLTTVPAPNLAGGPLTVGPGTPGNPAPQTGLAIAGTGSSAPVLPSGQPPAGPSQNSSIPAPAPGVAATPSPVPPAVPSSSVTLGPPPVPSPVELSPADLVQRVDPCIVRVNVKSDKGEGHGSGFIVDTTGIVVTNYHVIEAGISGQVSLQNGTQMPIVGYLYLNHKTDIAILRVDPQKANLSLIALPLATELPRKGIAVTAFGAPLGLDFTASGGDVSALRDAAELKEMIGLEDHEGTWIQTTAPISPGNSGGPLVNRFGEVVAINTLTLTEGQNLNFGISAMDIRKGMNQLASTPIAMSVQAAPAYNGTPMDGLGGMEIVDAIGTERAKQLMRDLKAVTFVRRAFTYDHLGTVTASVDHEARELMKKAQVRESLSANAALIIIMQLKSAGNENQLWINAQLLVRDKSGGSETRVMIWEKTGDVGLISDRALFTGNLPQSLRKSIVGFFRELRTAITDAKKSAEPAPGSDPAAAAVPEK